MVSCTSISDAYRVEAQLLRTFVAVARLGSFSGAAVELGYTQAAISQQIAALESDLKVPLLNRRPVSPTEAGARLLEHAEALLLQARRGQGRRHADDPAAGCRPRRGRNPAGSGLARAGAGALRAPPTAAEARRHGSGETARARAHRGRARRVRRRPGRRPDRPGRSAPGVLVADRRRHQPGGRRDRAPVRSPAGRASRPAAVGPGRRAVDRGARRDLAAGGDPPAGRRGRVPARLPLRRIGRHVAHSARGGRARPHPAAGNGPARRPGSPRVRVASPRVVHRVELVHGTLREGSPAAELAALLAPRG